MVHASFVITLCLGHQSLGVHGEAKDLKSTQCLLQTKKNVHRHQPLKGTSVLAWQQTLRLHADNSEEKTTTDLPFSLLQSDIEEMAAGIDVDKSIISQARKMFNKVADKMRSFYNYTSGEMTNYKERFATALDIDCDRKKKAEHHKCTFVDLQFLVMKELSNQRPVISSYLIKIINAKKSSFKAGKNLFNRNLTMEEYNQKMGTLLDGVNEDLTKPTPASNNSMSLSSAFEPPTSFDGRKHWSKCEQTIGHVRDQGLCGSCWAQSTIGVLNDRLCIESKGQFTKHLSIADITACDTTNFGCNGGSPKPASEWLSKHGVVTGGDFPDKGSGSSCYPYPIAEGNSRKHFHTKFSFPECQTTCVESKYPRTYSQDKYFAAGTVYLVGPMQPHKSANDGWKEIKTEISTKGSVIMVYAATADHMAYQSGIWDCPEGKPNHGVKCVGYGVDETHGNFITCVNSWNVDFGEHGFFHMKWPGNGCVFAVLGLPVEWAGKNQEVYSGKLSF